MNSFRQASKRWRASSGKAMGHAFRTASAEGMTKWPRSWIVKAFKGEGKAAFNSLRLRSGFGPGSSITVCPTNVSFPARYNSPTCVLMRAAPKSANTRRGSVAQEHTRTPAWLAARLVLQRTAAFCTSATPCAKSHTYKTLALHVLTMSVIHIWWTSGPNCPRAILEALLRAWALFASSGKHQCSFMHRRACTAAFFDTTGPTAATGAFVYAPLRIMMDSANGWTAHPVTAEEAAAGSNTKASVLLISPFVSASCKKCSRFGYRTPMSAIPMATSTSRQSLASWAARCAGDFA